ncbi:hypothetical protein P7K49_007273 [Saguinus oedipus]|uniref:GMP reductase n=1 Tax=Saguinus oedipus TaxID=9490 RepID=A0ABQ9VUK8_SAGOE|nr:hypothetical protein P7K49_007273 [Saguinus oedipus]
MRLWEDSERSFKADCSVCTTRTKTGVGYPQLSAVIECADSAHGLKGHIISVSLCLGLGLGSGVGAWGPLEEEEEEEEEQQQQGFG